MKGCGKNNGDCSIEGNGNVKEVYVKDADKRALNRRQFEI